MSRLSVIKAVWYEGRVRSMERLEKPAHLLGNVCMIDDFLIIFLIVDSYKGDI